MAREDIIITGPGGETITVEQPIVLPDPYTPVHTNDGEGSSSNPYAASDMGYFKGGERVSSLVKSFTVDTLPDDGDDRLNSSTYYDVEYDLGYKGDYTFTYAMKYKPFSNISWATREVTLGYNKGGNPIKFTVPRSCPRPYFDTNQAALPFVILDDTISTGSTRWLGFENSTSRIRIWNGSASRWEDYSPGNGVDGLFVFMQAGGGGGGFPMWLENTTFYHASQGGGGGGGGASALIYLNLSRIGEKGVSWIGLRADAGGAAGTSSTGSGSKGGSAVLTARVGNNDIEVLRLGGGSGGGGYVGGRQDQGNSSGGAGGTAEVVDNNYIGGNGIASVLCAFEGKPGGAGGGFVETQFIGATGPKPGSSGTSFGTYEWYDTQILNILVNVRKASVGRGVGGAQYYDGSGESDPGISFKSGGGGGGASAYLGYGSGGHGGCGNANTTAALSGSAAAGADGKIVILGFKL